MLRERRVAYKAVQRAIEKGELVRQPCEVCGGWPVDCHHDDYSSPLDVRFFCRGCHKLVHRILNEAKRLERCMRGDLGLDTAAAILASWDDAKERLAAARHRGFMKRRAERAGAPSLIG